MHDPMDALVDREHGAHGEQHERDDERVEVALCAEPELVLFGLLSLRPVAADEEQRLVAGVGDRVDGLGQQRGGSGNDEGDELRDGDAEVRRQRGKDGTLAVVPATGARPRAGRGARGDRPSLPRVVSRRVARLVDQQHRNVVAYRVRQAAVGPVHTSSLAASSARSGEWHFGQARISSSQLSIFITISSRSWWPDACSLPSIMGSYRCTLRRAAPMIGVWGQERGAARRCRPAAARPVGA